VEAEVPAVWSKNIGLSVLADVFDAGKCPTVSVVFVKQHSSPVEGGPDVFNSRRGLQCIEVEPGVGPLFKQVSRQASVLG
jgi:hypothetical protein